HRLSKLLLRNDRRMPTTCWGVTRRRWLGQQRFEEAPRQAAFDDYLHALDLVDARVATLERGIAALAADPAFAELVGRLRRQHGQDPLVRARAWRCQQRLYRRWRRMAARGKPRQKIVVACARELAGFIWAIATNQPLRAEG